MSLLGLDVPDPCRPYCSTAIPTFDMHMERARRAQEARVEARMVEDLPHDRRGQSRSCADVVG